VRNIASPAVLALFLVAISVTLAALAAGLAIARPARAQLDTSLVSNLTADYSANPDALTFAPLDQEIVEITRRDRSELEPSDGVEIVPIFYNGDPPPQGDDIFVDPPPTPSPTPSPSPQPTPSGDATETPTPTPDRTGTPTLSPTPTAVPNVTPTPKVTPGPPLSTPTPTPTPPGGALWALYLHNDPSPPLGDTASQSTLPCDPILPLGPTLFNYDTDRDAFPGLQIAKGGSGPDETDPTKYQAWRTASAAASQTIGGNLRAELWVAVKGFATGGTGAGTVYLRDKGPGPTVTVAQGSFSFPATVSSWVPVIVGMNIPSYNLAAGHSLELTIVVSSLSGDDLWFAYDTGAHPARIAGY
jgi:hypothetical protein